MQVKSLFDDRYRIVAVLNGDKCPVEEFLALREATTQAARKGLITFLTYVAEHGFQNAPSTWTHEVNKQNGIYEFIKGPLRLFFFKGKDRDIAICTVGGRKKGQKVDQSAVAASISCKDKYDTAYANGTYEVIEDENQ